MIGYSLVQEAMQQLDLSVERPCKYCGEPTVCHCGCCHSDKCNIKRANELSAVFAKNFKK